MTGQWGRDEYEVHGVRTVLQWGAVAGRCNWGSRPACTIRPLGEPAALPYPVPSSCPAPKSPTSTPLQAAYAEAKQKQQAAGSEGSQLSDGASPPIKGNPPAAPGAAKRRRAATPTADGPAAAAESPSKRCPATPADAAALRRAAAAAGSSNKLSALAQPGKSSSPDRQQQQQQQQQRRPDVRPGSVSLLMPQSSGLLMPPPPPVPIPLPAATLRSGGLLPDPSAAAAAGGSSGSSSAGSSGFSRFVQECRAAFEVRRACACVAGFLTHLLPAQSSHLADSPGRPSHL